MRTSTKQGLEPGLAVTLLAVTLLAVTLLAVLPTVAWAARAHPAQPAGAAGVGHIVYVGADGNLIVVRPDGSGSHAVTGDGSTTSPYAQPTWSPSGTGILAIRTFPSLKSLSSTGLWLVSPAGGTRQLSPNVPRGYAWAPDGQTVVYEEGYPPDTTSLVQFDTRTGRKRTVSCDATFRLLAVTGIGNRAIGVQGRQIEAVSLADGSAQALTSFGGKDGVWQNLVVPIPSGRTVLYAATPGTRLFALDLRSGRGKLATAVSSAVAGVAPSPDLRWIAYAAAAPGQTLQSVLVHVDKGAASLRNDSYVSPQAFAPTSTTLTYTARAGGSSAIFVAPTSCPASCARRLGVGQDAAWGP